MRRKPYYIKYCHRYSWGFIDDFIDWEWTKRYKTQKAMKDAIKDMVGKGHKIIETGYSK